MKDKIDETIKCSMKKKQKSSQVAIMVKKAAATPFTAMI